MTLVTKLLHDSDAFYITIYFGYIIYCIPEVYHLSGFICTLPDKLICTVDWMREEPFIMH